MKIFQHFFTAKPTRHRTGLGLSYDIVKVHGGVPISIGIKVETLSAEAAAQAGKDGERRGFIIQLSII